MRPESSCARAAIHNRALIVMFACLHAPGNLPLLVECAGYFSPLLEETSPDTVVFDIRGLGWIHGTVEQIASEIQRRVGIAANLAIASNPDAAVHAARGIHGMTILPPDHVTRRRPPSFPTRTMRQTP